MNETEQKDKDENVEDEESVKVMARRKATKMRTMLTASICQTVLSAMAMACLAHTFHLSVEDVPNCQHANDNHKIHGG